MICNFPILKGKYIKVAFLVLLMTVYILYIKYSPQPSIERLLEYPQPSIERLLEYPREKGPKYLVYSSKCRIPNLDPFNHEIEGLYKKNEYVACTKKPLLSYLTVNGSQAMLHINKSIIAEYSKSEISCCYENVTRRFDKNNPERNIEISPCEKFIDKTTIKEDVVIVKCKNSKKGANIYENAHAPIKMKENVKIKLKSIKLENHLSVLFIGIDSVSRLNMMRELPKTQAFLQTNNWLELRGYNKIADNTFPNFLAFLAGINDDNKTSTCEATVLGSLDKCDFIWNDYRTLGYVTAYAEDEPKISTFNYNTKKGFIKPPTDYYFRTYMQAAEKLKQKKFEGMTYCTGPETSGERILNLASNFAETFKDHPYFGLFWMNSYSHNDLNSVSRMDNKIYGFLEVLTKKQVLNNTIVVFFSDHGVRFGKIRTTRTGWLEERLPMFFLSIPKWFQHTYPEKFNSLLINQNRLTTPYDVYMTLQDILVLSGKNYTKKSSSGCSKCKSLFEEAEIDRSCEDACIKQHWCTCGGYVNIPVENATAKAAAKYILDEIEHITHSSHNSSTTCQTYKLKKVTSVSISESGDNWYKNDTYLLLVLKTVPEAIFESTVSFSSKNGTFNFQTQGTISRLDYYEPHSKCTNDSYLKKYCYCR